MGVANFCPTPEAGRHTGFRSALRFVKIIPEHLAHKPDYWGSMVGASSGSRISLSQLRSSEPQIVALTSLDPDFGRGAVGVCAPAKCERR